MISALDTHQTVKSLTNLSNIATKTDIADLQRAMVGMKAALVKWVVGVGFARVATILAVLKLRVDHPRPAGSPMRRLAGETARIGLLAIVLVAQAALLSRGAGAASDLPYLFQQLNSPAYKRSFEVLFRGEKNLAPWLRAYLKNRNGVDAPGQMVEVAGDRYELYQVCQPHNCPGNDIYVLFSPGGDKAWALFTKEGGDYRFFGKPGQQQQALLRAAAQ